MVQESPAYRRLAGPVRMFAGSHSLYLAPDHLLSVVNSGFAESYQRFSFSDIQALVLTESARRHNLNLVLGLVAAGVLAAAVILGLTVSTLVAVSILVAGAILLGSLFGWNAYLGATCTCAITTAVQTQTLPALRRIRPSLAILERIQELALAAQAPSSGPLLKPARTPIATSGAITAGPVFQPWLQRSIRHESGRWHFCLFSMFLLAAALSAADMALTSLILTVAGTLQSMVLAFVVVGALIRQRDSDLFKPVRVTTWCALGSISLQFVLGHAYYYFFFLQNLNAPNQWEWLKILAAATPADSPLVVAIYLYGTVSSTVLGFLGLGLLLYHWRRRPNNPAPRPAGNSESENPAS